MSTKLRFKDFKKSMNLLNSIVEFLIKKYKNFNLKL